MKILKALLPTFLLISTIVKAQPAEVNLLNNINPTIPNSNFWINTSHSVYPIALAAPVASFVVGSIKKNKNLQQKGVQTFTTLIVNTTITQGLKFVINRQRPYIKYPNLIVPYTIESDASFPSGHTSTAFATATSLTLNYKKWYVAVPAYLWASGVGYSRLYLGEHYPTDVAAGMVVGVGSAYLSHWLTKKYFAKKKKIATKQ